MSNLALQEYQKKNNLVQEALNIAVKNHSTGNITIAKNLYEQILKIDSENVIALHLMGVIAYQSGQNDLSIKLISKALVIKPNYCEAYNNLGNVYKAKNNIKHALICYKKAITINLNYAEAHFNLGNIFKEQNKMEEAIKCFNKAILLKPNYIEAIINLANTFLSLSNYENAIINYKKVIQINPNKPEAYCNLGLIMKEQGRLDEAIIYIRKSLYIKPNFSEAYNNLGNIYKEQGKLKDAIKYYNLAIDANLNYIDSYLNKGLILQELGDYEDAINTFEKALKLDVTKKIQFLDNHILRCLFFQGNKIKFSNKLDHLISSNHNNSLIGSLCSRGNIKYNLKRYNPFCNYPMKYIFYKSLYKDYDFEKTFIKNISNIFNNKNLNIRSQKLLINGKQTAGNLFVNKHRSMNEIKKIIFKELENYKNKFKDSNEGFILDWPDKYAIHGWVVKMKSEGVIRPHMHDKGWISGSIYINVPNSKRKNDGNLVLCIEEKENLRNKRDVKEKTVKVKTGTLCLFPSSLLHYSLPFKSDEERIVLAFDIIPQ